MQKKQYCKEISFQINKKMEEKNMNENLKQAILKVKEMPEVQEKLTKAETLEEVYEIMQSAGFTVSFMGSMMR